jgi:alginate O-acetyltransferase complex protein AlgI
MKSRLASIVYGTVCAIQLNSERCAMALNSLSFLFVFLPITVSGYWLLTWLGGKKPLLWLLAASIVFYMCASPWSLAVIVPSILLDYGIARLVLSLDGSRAKARTSLVVVGIVANVLFLAYFKYRNFFVETVGALVGVDVRLEALLLPLGVSFLVFQKIAFLCDMHSERIASIRFLDFLLFTLFFPRTIAGPIVHYKEVIPQIYQRESASNWSNIVVGFCLLSLGLFKKCVIGDGVAQFVPSVFDSDLSNSLVGPLNLTDAWLGALAYTLQLYFDFSGYSDMALGAARMVGIRLPMNFNSPLKACSMVEYWGRWHITLTRFLTWHIYIPLVRRITQARATRRRPLLRGQKSTPSAILSLIALPTGVTMLVSGIWHGAGWQFLIWGVLHGVYLSINQAWRLLRPRFWANQAKYERVMRPIGWFLTFTSVVVALVLFRSRSISDALSILASMAGVHGFTPHAIVLAQRAGFYFDWLRAAEPLAPLFWILPLLAAVLVLPNSLELLRRFSPAIDFPPNARDEMQPSPDRQESAPRDTLLPRYSPARRLYQLWSACRKIGELGFALNRPTAIVVSIMFVLGAMAVGRGGGFLYGGF